MSVAGTVRREPAATAAEGEWLTQRERGTVAVIRATYLAATLLGRRFMRLVVCLIALWYRLLDRRAVASSRAFLRRVWGREPSFGEGYHHLRTFAQVTVDRIFLLTGRTEAFAFTRTGHEHLVKQLATGRGALLIGAHLGSYEAMRAGGVTDEVPIDIVGDFRNSRQINALLESLNPGQAARVIHLGEDPVGATMRMRNTIEAGHLVASLADRVGPGGRPVRARFLGEEAFFNAGPFVLAHVLECPVYLVFGIFREPNRYELHCEPFAERLVLPRRDRRRHMEEHVQRYAERVEAFARAAPYNWFNFFDLWGQP